MDVWGTDHGGFVDDDQGALVDVEVVIPDQLERFVDGQPAVAGLVAHRLIDRFTGGREHQDFLVAAARSGAQRFE